MSRQLISHIGIAVSDLEAAVERFRLIADGPPSDIVEVTDQKVRVALFGGARDGSARIELVAPTSDDSPVTGFIKKRGEGLHHLCVYVDDIEKTLGQLKAAGVRLIDEAPRRGAEGHLIAFVHPADMNGVLVELEQRTE